MIIPKDNHFWICVKLYQHAKNQLVASVYWDTVNSRVQRPHLPQSFLIMSHQKLSNQRLIFVNLYQHVQNDAASSICSGGMLDLKILQCKWLREFWHISQEHFSQIEDLYWKTTNNIFGLFFDPFPQFLRGKKCSSWKSDMYNLIRFSSTMLKFRETWWSNSKKTTQQTADTQGFGVS